MEVEPNTGKTRNPHRPLPSVDLALLPHQRRAIRIRNTTIAVCALLVVGGGAAAAFFTSDLLRLDDDTAVGVPIAPPAAEETTRSAEQVEPPPYQGGAVEQISPDPIPMVDNRPPPASGDSSERPAVPTETKKRDVSRRFGKARGFREALHSAGASRDEASALIEALQKLVDFRRCRPEHELVFERDDTGALRTFEYRIDPTEIYRAIRDRKGAFRAKAVEIPVEKRRVAKGGIVSRSLGHALEELGLGRSFAGIFVQVFEGHFDFRKETRAGDAFKVIVDEEYVKGDFQGLGTVHALEYTGHRASAMRAFFHEPKQGKSDFFDAGGLTMQGGWLRTPLRHDHISSGYNTRRLHPVLKRVIPHLGMDYAASPGTIVWAAADGVVSFAGEKGANGNLIVLRHDNGYESFYAHLSRVLRGIRAGVLVQQRQPIGTVGSTGLSTGPHLHFALKRRGRFVDPISQLNGPGKPLPAAESVRFQRSKRRLLAELEKIKLARAPAPAKIQEPPPETSPVGVPQGYESLDFLQDSSPGNSPGSNGR